MNKSKIYNLLLNHQEEFLMTLTSLGIKNPLERIKNLLDEQIFDVLECDEQEIIAIKKKSTGEIFRKGCRFYYIKYDTWVEDAYFDNSELFGTYYFNHFYQNYVRGSGGMYHLNEISLTEMQPKETQCDEPEEINLNGKIYTLKK
jgi:hypothetical protein